MSTSISDLFAGGPGERLPVPEAELLLWRCAVPDAGDDLLGALVEETRWRQEHVTLWGRTYPQPRLVAFHGDAGHRYTYSGITLEALPWTPLLLGLKHRVEALCETPFNTVLLNYYRDHRDSMGFHADDEPELGPDPAIASLSIGEARQFVMKHRHREDVDDVRFELPPGSLLLMSGATQANWKHGIPKRSRACGPRVNLTFRTII